MNRHASASKIKPRVSRSRDSILRGRRSSSIDGRSGIPVRSMSTGRQNPGETLLQPHASRSAGPKRAFPKLLFRSKSCLSTPLEGISRGSSKLVTPQMRLDRGKSPQKLKQQYTNLDEKVHVPRIKQFIVNQGATSLEVTKPVRINDFIGIVQLFKTILVSPSMPEVTNKNYKTAIPAMMKTLKYPITITQSFLKTPNTPQNFTHVLAIWTFLMDLVDIISEPWTGMSQVSKMMFQFGNKSLDSLEVRAEIEATAMAQQGLTIESYQAQKAHVSCELEKMSAQVKSMKTEVGALQLDHETKRESRRALAKQREELAKKTQEVCTLIQREDEQKHYNKKRLGRAQSEEKQKFAALDDITRKIQTIGCTPEEVDALDNEIERCNHRLTLLHKRHEELKELHRDQQDTQRQVERDALALIMNFNTQILKSSLPEGQKMRLKLDETEIRMAQVQQVKAHVEQLLEQTRKSQVEYLVLQQEANIKLHGLEVQLADMLKAAQEAKRKRAEGEAQLKKMKAEQDTMFNLIDDESRKIDRLQELIKLAVVKRTVVMDAMKKHHAETTFCMQQMKSYTEKINALFKDTAHELMQKELEMIMSFGDIHLE